MQGSIQLSSTCVEAGQDEEWGLKLKFSVPDRRDQELSVYEESPSQDRTSKNAVTASISTGDVPQDRMLF